MEFFTRLRLRERPVWLVPLLMAPFVIGGSFGAQDDALNSPHHYPVNKLDLFGVGLLAAGLAALLLRRRYPVATLAAAGGVLVFYMLRAYPYGPVILLAAVAIVAAVVEGHRAAAWAGTFLGLGGHFLVASAIGVPLPERGQGEQLFPVERPTLINSTLAVLWAAVVLSVAELVRISSERAAEAESKRREQERRRASEERLRIARELHDVLAHNISMINVQAGVALHLMDGQPGPAGQEAARTALAAIKEASKEALAEMRSVIGVLRQQGESAPRAPAAGLARLDDLLERARSAGLTVHADLDLPQDLPAQADLAAFRIVQESLTNITRHAGPGPVNVWVQIAYRDREMSIRIDDDGRGAPLLPEHSGGSGLHGMRERVAALGGEFSAGPRPGGGFRVGAVLPTDRVEA